MKYCNSFRKCLLEYLSIMLDLQSCFDKWQIWFLLTLYFFLSVFSFFSPCVFSNSVQFSCSVVSDSLWPMDCRTPGFPVYHQLPGFVKLMSTESVILSNHLILYHPLLLLPSICLSHISKWLSFEKYFSPVWTFLSSLPFDALFQGFRFKNLFIYFWLWCVFVAAQAFL